MIIGANAEFRRTDYTRGGHWGAYTLPGLSPAPVAATNQSRNLLTSDILCRHPLMRVGNSIVVHMLADPVVYFPRCILRIDVEGGRGKVGQVVQQLMPRLHGNRVTFFDREFRIHRQIQLRM